ncbi:MAG: acyl-CoA dehydrogenase family protein, partial [Actinobacteria bacterium]|nr:acyl-CoA dehydrogenase family protein [Actinomycetota bacterium]
QLLPRICRGELNVALAVPRGPSPTATLSDAALRLSGAWPSVLAATGANLVLGPVILDGKRSWVIAELKEPASASRASLDETRSSGPLGVDGLSASVVEIADEEALALIALMACGELTGIARRCLSIAADYARDRVQFGRPIGQFQGVKHKLANLAVAVEQMTATTWDAANALEEGASPDALLATAIATGNCVAGGSRAARDLIQTLGGMGYTWEHDAHLYLRRALSWRAVLGAPSMHFSRVGAMAAAGHRRRVVVDLPEEAGAIREELAPLVESLLGLTGPDLQAAMADLGFLFPHWPRPFGREASPVEQLVLEELLNAKQVRRPRAHVASWALPTIVAHGTADQQERFVTPSLREGTLWCQLFSEPEAGSDLAALSTKASKVEGGWIIDGQKVWTSAAKWAKLGILLARTDPDAAKHDGITYFILDMASEGVEIRGLKELTGEELFNEVFLNSVFIPDDCVIGAVNGGWKLARTTLANERVSMGSFSAFGEELEACIAMADPEGDALVGELIAEAHSLASLRARTTLRSLGGLEPGSEASVAKLIGAEHDQRVAECGLDLLAGAGLFLDGEAQSFAHEVIQTLCLTIAGGTSEVQRNLIGERMLKLPRDPEPAN